ncbi:MAG: hypothetical protein Q9184_001121 [Pyrenodesmia sp. 2 TL-2023]
MSSFTGLLKRGPSKSEKVQTPPRVVYGDLGSAYASIAQRGTPITPDFRSNAVGGVTSPAETNATWSPLQSPHSRISTSAPLLQDTVPYTICNSPLSEDLSIPNDLGAESLRPGQSIDPFTTSQNRDSINTLDFKKHVLDTHFNTTDNEVSRINEDAPKDGSRQITNVLSSNDYPELHEGQLEACAQLSGADQIIIGDTEPLNRSATIQSIPSRHGYGRLGTNADIRSVRGSHVDVQLSGDEHVQDIQWSPRPSSELHMLGKVKAHDNNPPIHGPPTSALPRTPQRTGFFRNGSVNDYSSPVGQASHSSQSYDNTRRLLDLSQPRVTGTFSQDSDLFEGLKKFAKEGSSSRGNSSKSFATFSIKEADGNTLTRPVSQTQFQQLESVISSRIRRSSQVNDTGLLHVGEISINFAGASNADIGPGSSQTTSSELRPDLDLAAVQPSLRTRNGTPPLLFRASIHLPKETDWETVGESNKTTSSIADYSDSVSDHPPKTLFSTEPGKLFERPIHPRYNHSWDLKQDLRNGGYVLTPIHKITGGVSFPNEHTIGLSSSPAARNYSHPTPLATNHDHPFASSAPQIRPSDSSMWISTAGEEAAGATKTPPVPSRNPYRRQRRISPVEEIELQTFCSDPIERVNTEPPTPSTSRTRLVNPFDDPVPTSPHRLARPANVVLADTITPPRRSAGMHRHGLREWVPLPHPVYSSPNRCSDVPHLSQRDPEPGPPMTYEQRVARHFLAVCALLPVLLPFYALGYLDFLMRIYTGGQITEFPTWEKRACWGLVAAWVFVALCIIPFATITNIH